LMSGKALQLLASTGQKERALVELAQVEHDLRRLKTNWDQVFGTLSLARACGQVGGREQVLRLLEGLEPRVKRLSGAAERVKALSKMIEILGSAGELDRALELAGRAEALAPRISYAWEKVSAYGLIARALFSIQQDAFAGRKVDKALQVVDATRDKGQATIAQALLAQTLAEAGQQSRAIALVRLAFERAMSLDPDQEGNKWSALLVAVQVALRAGEQEMAVTMASEMANAIVNSGARVYAQEWFMDSALYCLNMAARSLHDAGLKEQALSTWKMQFSDPARASSLDVLSAIEYARVLLSTEMLGEIDEIVEEVKGW